MFDHWLAKCEACDPFLTYGLPCWFFDGSGFSRVFLDEKQLQRDGAPWWTINREALREKSKG